MKNNTTKILQMALILAGSTPAIMLPVLVAPQNTTTVQAAQNVDVTGTVVEVRAGRGFTFTPDNRGGTYTVTSDKLPNGLNRGDKVRVRGTLNGTQVAATEIRVTQSTGNPTNTQPIANNGNVKNVTGRVEAVRGRDGFTFRPDNRNETYTVRARTLPAGLKAGDSVRVRGTLNGTQLAADDVRLVTAGNAAATGNFDGLGTVRAVRNDGFTFRPDGRNDDYTVRGNNFPRDLRVGDKVRVRGEVRGREVVNAQLQNANNGRDEPKRGIGNGEAVEFDAQVHDVKDPRHVQVHVNSGARYEIYSNRDLNLREGDYVRVSGIARRGGFYAIDADNVTQSSASDYRNQGPELRTALKDRNNGINNPNRNDPIRNDVRLRGRVEKLKADRFTILVDDSVGGTSNNGDYPNYGNNNAPANYPNDDSQRYNGRRFEVRWDNRNNQLRNGDFVDVAGLLNTNTAITADRVNIVYNR